MYTDACRKISRHPGKTGHCDLYLMFMMASYIKYKVYTYICV